MKKIVQLRQGIPLYLESIIFISISWYLQITFFRGKLNVKCEVLYFSYLFWYCFDIIQHCFYLFLKVTTNCNFFALLTKITSHRLNLHLFLYFHTKCGLPVLAMFVCSLCWVLTYEKIIFELLVTFVFIRSGTVSLFFFWLL